MKEGKQGQAPDSHLKWESGACPCFSIKRAPDKCSRWEAAIKRTSCAKAVQAGSCIIKGSRSVIAPKTNVAPFHERRNQKSLEEDGDLALGRSNGVGAMDYVFVHDQAEVATDGARSCLCRVGSAH